MSIFHVFRRLLARRHRRRQRRADIAALSAHLQRDIGADETMLLERYPGGISRP